MIEPVSKDKCLPEILALFPDLIAHRHDIHQHPDCGFETQRTIGKIKEFLEKHNVSSKDMDDATCPGSLFVNFQRFPTLDAKKLVNAPKMSAHHRGICHF